MGGYFQRRKLVLSVRLMKISAASGSCLKISAKSVCVPWTGGGVDANDYFCHFLKRRERFVIRVKKNRNVIYNGKTCNIMDVAGKYEGSYRMHGF